MSIYEAIDVAKRLVENWRGEDDEKVAYYEGILHGLNWIADGGDHNAVNAYRIFSTDELQCANI